MALDQSQWPANAPERRAIGSLRPFPRNARTHSPAQIEQVAASIREWGWTMPVLIDEAGEIIAGHARVRAAQLLGLEEIPVIVARGWTQPQKRAYVLADNKLTLNAEWDDALLALELGELKSEGFDLGLTGFEPIEIDALFAKAELRAGLTDPDAVTVPPFEPFTQPGDVWQLGHHRLVCGDSTKGETVARALDGARPHLMVTDPPYGVEYDAAWRQRAGLQQGGAYGQVLNDSRADWREAWALFAGDVAYVWHAGLHAGVVAESLRACGFEIRSMIVWAKSRLVIGRGHYHWQHEPCWYAVRQGATGHWSGDRNQSTLWQIDKPIKSETGHSAQKPVEAMLRPIVNNSHPSEAVYEPFSGSGTTIIASEMSGRRCHAIELNPAYVDVAVRRWQDYTGEPARRASDGAALPAQAGPPAGDGTALGSGQPERVDAA